MKKKSKRNTSTTIKSIDFSKHNFQKVWCAFCGVWGNHTSGGCEDLKKQLKNNAKHPRKHS